MAFIEGDARAQGTLFPVTLEELIPEDHFWGLAVIYQDVVPTGDTRLMGGA